MPFKAKLSSMRRQRRRATRPRNGNRSGISSKGNNNNTGFLTRQLVAPNKFNTRLPWTLTKQVTTASSASGRYSYVLQAANPYDPDFTDGTSTYQPQGFDNWSAFYTYWFVNNCTLQIEICNTNSDKNLLISVGPSSDQLASTYLIHKNFPRTVSKVLSHTGTATFKTQMTYSTNVIRDTNPRDNNQYRGAFGTPPGLTWYWLINIETFDLTSFTADWQVTLIYDIQMSQPKKMAYS